MIANSEMRNPAPLKSLAALLLTSVDSCEEGLVINNIQGMEEKFAPGERWFQSSCTFKIKGPRKAQGSVEREREQSTGSEEGVQDREVPADGSARERTCPEERVWSP